MKVVPRLEKLLTGLKVTLREAEVLFNINGLSSISEIQSKLGYTRLKTVRIIKEYQRKGILKLRRQLAK